MPQDKVLARRDGGVAVITLNRPEARNALTPEMVQDIASALEEAKDDEVRCLVITGSDGAFCAGADIKDFIQALEESGPEGLSQHLHALATRLHQQVILPIRRLPVPVIAAVNGVAAGAGFSLALASDLRIVSEDARLVMAYAGIGATADGGSTYLLPRLVGLGRALEMYLNNTAVHADRALEMGLINEVVPADKLADRTMELAHRLAAGPTAAYGRVKALMDSSWSADLPRHLEEEARALADMGLTPDFQEGISAFAAKRPPRFQGR